MNSKAAEVVAALVTVVAIGLAATGPFLEEARAVRDRASPDARVLALTGIASTGTWTLDDVNGTNYWSRSFRPARPVFRLGRDVLLRLRSADVTHTFYCPGLGIGPLDVHAGHLVEVIVRPKDEGIYPYYCTTFCGDPHFGMRGEIVVVRAEGTMHQPPASDQAPAYWKEAAPKRSSIVARGRWLFRRKGCFLCHGEEAKGGVQNWNYVKDTVPALNTLAERMMLQEKKDADRIVELLGKGIPLRTAVTQSPFPRFRVVLAQYDAIRDVVRKGSPPGKKDPNGPMPPLEMPAWRERLSDADIDAIVAYLLTLQPWEQKEDE